MEYYKGIFGLIHKELIYIIYVFLLKGHTPNCWEVTHDEHGSKDNGANKGDSRRIR